MGMNRIRAVLLPLLLILAPAALSAQQDEPFDPARVPLEAQALFTELQQVQARLQPIHQEALRHPELQAAQAELTARIGAAMIELDPSTGERMARLQTLIDRGKTAEAAEDEAALNEIAAEARQIQEHLQAAQLAAIRRPDIAPGVEAFQAKLMERMVEVDPEAAALIQRAQELDARLAAVLGQGG